MNEIEMKCSSKFDNGCWNPQPSFLTTNEPVDMKLRKTFYNTTINITKLSHWDVIPYGLVARIASFHPTGSGSLPDAGNTWNNRLLHLYAIKMDFQLTASSGNGTRDLSHPKRESYPQTNELLSTRTLQAFISYGYVRKQMLNTSSDTTLVSSSIV